MSRKPSDAVRAKDRERKRKAYQPKTHRGELAAKARAYAVAFAAWSTTPNGFPSEEMIEASEALVEHFEVMP